MARIAARRARQKTEKAMKRTRVLAALVAVLALGLLGVPAGAGAAELSTHVQVNVKPTLKATVGLGTAEVTATAFSEFTLANGTGANQADSVFTATYVIGSGATQSIDLKGSLTDALGMAFTPAKLRLVKIVSKTSNTTNLTLFGDANSVPILSTLATTTTLTPGDIFFQTNRSAAGWAVTAGTGDIVKIVNAAGASAVVDVVLIGSSS
jgi:hypothetical protein